MAAAPADWQLECTKLKQRGAYLLQTGQWSDCTFLVGTEPNQVVISGHKLILAMASPVFEAMFYGGMAERNDPILILDVQIDAFKALLEYIYTGNINLTSFDKACELCYGAKKYMLPHLVKECTRYLWSDLYPRNACRAYEFARLFDENVLMEKCLQIISTNTKDVLCDNSFEDVELNTVITVFSLDHLNVDSELDLFNAAVRYAKALEKRASERSVSPCNDSPSETTSKSPEPSTSKENSQVVNVESSGENSPEAAVSLEPVAVQPAPTTTPKTSTDAGPAPVEPVPEPAATAGGCGSCDAVETHPPDPSDTKKPNKSMSKPSLRNVIEKIRFLTLTAQQFAEGPARSSLLTESEAFAVLMNILSNNSDVPMPTGFSISRTPRRQLIGCGGPSCNNMTTFVVDTPSPVLVEHVWSEGGRVAPLPFHPPYYPYPARVEGTRQPGIIVDQVDRHNSDLHKIYCQRGVVLQTDCLNTNVLDCSVTFMVDKNICLLGIQVPTQAPSEESGGAGGTGGAAGSALGPGYSELLYAHLLDADGARLTYTHYTSRVPYRHLLDIIRSRPSRSSLTSASDRAATASEMALFDQLYLPTRLVSMI
ncbi:unnamed protein product [Leptidea sinapis]|uniref:BTB domain-containing protein n=1 Tax=Leptidea sinapis TaxID=189913 RepID=A0A5E4R6X1_9NEOP|nr:unnamed protein product [Leptidea sinapis]